jgi:hypothetical protein
LVLTGVYVASFLAFASLYWLASDPCGLRVSNFEEAVFVRYLAETSQNAT